MKAADLPLHYNAIEILEHNLATRSSKGALFSDSRSLTFQQLSAEVNRVANALKAAGVRPGEYVGLLAHDTPEWVICFFATLKIGAIHVGINTLLTPEEYDYILNDCRARILIVSEPLLEKIEVIRERQSFLEEVIVLGDPQPGALGYKQWIDGHPTTCATYPTHREDIATLNYSSGSTGQPKGILHAHKDLILTAVLWGQNVLGLQEDDCTFALAKLFFTFGTGGNLLMPFSVGASIVLFAGSPRIAKDVMRQINRYRPTIFYNSPTGYAMTLAIPDLLERYDLSSLRLCVSAGEALPAPIWHQWKETTGLDIIDGIGATEVYHIFISNQPGHIKPGASGKPVPGYEVRIIDENWDDVQPGEIGNLILKGESIALSYLHQYDRSKRAFVGEWLFTGDKYWMDKEGYFYHAGRSDDMMKVGGIWASPTEIESTIISHPAVVECAVVAKSDQSELVKPKAFVVLKDNHPATPELAQEIISFCREHMAAYKRPRWVEFVDHLPKTATGKIQRFKLRGE
ncbi:MAG: benzoate-CoA ligase family protein [Ardenticatenaceae bacterium]|nr:benzoate-CoA ligase family protein [Ardenticatenaceae bacterium]